jgi:hypothetical protein
VDFLGVPASRDQFQPLSARVAKVGRKLKLLSAALNYNIILAMQAVGSTTHSHNNSKHYKIMKSIRSLARKHAIRMGYMHLMKRSITAAEVYISSCV